METRANYVLIGAFTLCGILGSLVLFLWLAKVEADRQFAYYDILFDSVSGLGEAGDVRYNGLLVGSVVHLALDRENVGKVRARIEVDAATPVKTDTVVTLELQGITGLSYVALAGGSAGAEPVRAGPGQDVPLIVARPSAIQNLFEGTPELLNRAIGLMERLNEVASAQNQEAFSAILTNLASASGELDSMLSDFSRLSGEFAEVSTRLTAFAGQLDAITASATTTLGTADETLKTARLAIEKSQGVMDEINATLAQTRIAIESANGLITGPVPALLGQVESTAGTVETVVTDLGGKAGGVIGKIDGAGDAALARLAEMQATIARLDATLDAAAATMQAIETTTRSIDVLVTGEGTALVTDARGMVAAAGAAIAKADRMMAEDLPPILADVRSAASNVNAVVAQAGTDLTGATGKLGDLATSADTTLAAATETFRRANEALDAVAATMATADGTLAAARQTLGGVDRVMDQEIGAIVTDIRGSIGGLSTAMDQVSADLPKITEEVRGTLARATSLAASLDGLVLQNSDEIEAFMKTGLPQFVRFVQEGSRLVLNLQRLATGIERDPARFLLGTQAPEYRR